MPLKGAVGWDIFDPCLHGIFHTFPLVSVSHLPVFQSLFKDLNLIFPEVGFTMAFGASGSDESRIFLDLLDIWILS